ncbi:MAG: hypothetical protein Ct9H90mP20_6110 [Candidatus Neomarinimicrobiota bacterium]|nr:MAG: hypothetical protein Ct9H90mP20_6110 [Candidatus Neomarinimicrobiota bacterium]
MFSGQADANGKIVRTDTGEILAVVPSAGVKNLIYLNQLLEPWRLIKLLKNWEKISLPINYKMETQQSNFIKVYIVLKGADFMSYMTFESFLKAQTVSGIRNAYAKSLNDGVAEFEVSLKESTGACDGACPNQSRWT